MLSHGWTEAVLSSSMGGGNSPWLFFASFPYDDSIVAFPNHALPF